MKSTLKLKGSVSGIFKAATLTFPLAVAALPTQAASPSTIWVGTETRAFLTPEQMTAFAAAPEAQATAGEPAHVVVTLRVRDMKKLEALGRAVNERGNAQYRHFLTPKVFLADFAPREAQVQKVVAHLRKSGFVNIRVAKNRLLISADGTAGTVKTAFNTPLVHFRKGNRGACRGARGTWRYGAVGVGAAKRDPCPYARRQRSPH